MVLALAGFFTPAGGKSLRYGGEQIVNGARRFWNWMRRGANNVPARPLGLGSTANLAKGTTLARNLREELAIEQAISNPSAGVVLERIRMNDPRWLASDGWVKMQQTVQSGGGEGPINVHYVYNTVTGKVDDFKIVIQGAR